MRVARTGQSQWGNNNLIIRYYDIFKTKHSGLTEKESHH